MRRLMYFVSCASTAVAGVHAQQRGSLAGHYVEHALSLPDHRWIHRTTPHADIYLLAGSDAEPLAPTIEPAVERAIAADLAWLGERFTGPRLTLFIVGSRSDIKPLINATYGGYPVFDEHAAFFVGSITVRPALRHEIMHLLSWQFWGMPATEWLSEGIATLAAPKCGGVARSNEMAARLDREGKFIPLETLWRHFDARDEVGVMNYVEGASLLAYIDRRWGREKLRAFWPTGAYKSIEQRLGVSLARLERDWRASLEHEKPARSWASYFAEVKAHGCE